MECWRWQAKTILGLRIYGMLLWRNVGGGRTLGSGRLQPTTKLSGCSTCQILSKVSPPVPQMGSRTMAYGSKVKVVLYECCCVVLYECCGVVLLYGRCGVVVRLLTRCCFVWILLCCVVLSECCGVVVCMNVVVSCRKNSAVWCCMNVVVLLSLCMNVSGALLCVCGVVLYECCGVFCMIRCMVGAPNPICWRIHGTKFCTSVREMVEASHIKTWAENCASQMPYANSK